MKCIHCGNPIPEGRAKFGYRECISCSTIEKVGCVDIVYHKTGNTIEILPVQEAEKMKKLGKRSSFGTLAGLKPGKDKSYSTSVYIADHSPDFEVTKQMAIDIKSSAGLERAKSWLARRYDDMRITKLELEEILEEFSPVKTVTKSKNVNRKNWYSRYEPKQEKSEIDPEVTDAFTNWRKW